MERFVSPDKLSKKKKKELDKKRRVWYPLPSSDVHKSKKDYDRKANRKEVREYDE